LARAVARDRYVQLVKHSLINEALRFSRASGISGAKREEITMTNHPNRHMSRIKTEELVTRVFLNERGARGATHAELHDNLARADLPTTRNFFIWNLIKDGRVKVRKRTADTPRLYWAAELAPQMEAAA
jgi:hypothetical protein